MDLAIVNQPQTRTLEFFQGPEGYSEFYEYALSQVEWLTLDEMREWQRQKGRFVKGFLTAGFEIKIKSPALTPTTRGVDELDIVINWQVFTHKGSEKYTPLIPYLLEHEIYEAWMIASGICLDEDCRHRLAREHEFKMAFNDGNGNLLREFLIATQRDEGEMICEICEDITDLRQG